MKKLFLFAGLITLIGTIIIVVFGFIARDELRSSAEDSLRYSKATNSFDVSDINTIEVDIDNRSLFILPSTTDKIEVKYYNNRNNQIVETINNNTISYNSTFKWNFTLFTNFSIFSLFINPDYHRFYIYLPKDILINLSFKTSNGRIEASGINADNLVIKSSNGGIQLSDVTADSISATSSNGAIIVENIKSSNEVTLDTSNGRIKATNVKTPNLNCGTSNGSINVRIIGSYEDYYIKMRTTNGDYYLNGVESHNEDHNSADLNKKIKLTTSNGDVKIFFE